MLKIHQDITPDGLVTEMWSDGDDLHVRHSQDAEPAFEAVLQSRNDGSHWQKGVKKGFVHAFHIPSGVVTELFGLGINVYQAPLKDIKAGLVKLKRYRACDMTGKNLV